MMLVLRLFTVQGVSVLTGLIACLGPVQCFADFAVAVVAECSILLHILADNGDGDDDAICSFAVVAINV